MNYFEAPSFCNLSEYQKDQANRVMPQELIVDELYILMAALNTKSVSRAAIKLPTRVQDVELRTSSSYAVYFSLLDADMQSHEQRWGEFRDGFWIDAHSEDIFKNAKLSTGYFKNYNTQFDENWKAISDSLSVRELIPA